MPSAEQYGQKCAQTNRTPDTARMSAAEAGKANAAYEAEKRRLANLKKN